MGRCNLLVSRGVAIGGCMKGHSIRVWFTKYVNVMDIVELIFVKNNLVGSWELWERGKCALRFLTRGV